MIIFYEVQLKKKIRSVVLYLLAFQISFSAPGQLQTEVNNISEISWSESENGLRLGVMACGSDVYFSLENVSDQKITVYSHVETSEKHFDPFSGQIYAKEAHVGAWDKTYIPVIFSDSRLKSASVSALLDKGESLSHELNLSHWLLKEVNQNRKLKGEFQFVLTYENESCSYCPDDQRNIWSGFLETPPVIVSFRLPATLELHVKIISVRPIGWGVLYIADVIEERNGQPHEFGRSMHFTLTSEHIELPASTELVLFLEDSGTFNETYLQPCNCSETDEKAIWHIKDFRVFIDEINTK